MTDTTTPFPPSSGQRGGDPAAPLAADWRARADDLSARWLAHVRDEQERALRELVPTEVELPIGPPVLAIRARVHLLLEAGRIPDGLTPFVYDLMATGANDRAAAVEEKIKANWGDWLRTLDVIWMACVVAPTYTRGGDRPGAILLSRVDVRDKIALFNWAQGVDDYLAAFRDEAGGPVRTAPAGDDVSGADAGDAPGTRPDPGRVAQLADQPGDDALRPVGGFEAERGSGGTGHAPTQEDADAAHSPVQLHGSVGADG